MSPDPVWRVFVAALYDGELVSRVRAAGAGITSFVSPYYAAPTSDPSGRVRMIADGACAWATCTLNSISGSRDRR
jgi:hypothetical protein